MLNGGITSHQQSNNKKKKNGFYLSEKEKMEIIDKVLNARNLTLACQQVVRNKGAAGVDGMNVKELKQYLDKNRDSLMELIRSKSYLPQAIRGKSIPKRNGKMRILGIPTSIDRMLQQAVLQTISPYFEFDFSENSFGFRPQRNTHQAVVKALDYINAGNQDIVDIDLKGYFDEVNHCKLLQLIYKKIKCKTTMCLIRRWLRVPIMIDGKLQKRRKGVPQGSPLSPLLSNIMLNELDKEMQKQNLNFVRYADDFSIYCKTKSKARKIGNQIYTFLKDKLNLPINREKSGIRRPIDFKILGYGFVPCFEKGVKGKYQLVVDKKRFTDLKAKLKEITRKTAPLSFDERMQKIKLIQRGWINYFKLANIYVKLKDIDGWLRNRIRYCIWHDWKKPERKRKNLIRLGVDYNHAYSWSRTRKGGWAVAQSPILVTTITIKRLEKRGYESLVDWYLKIKNFDKTPNLFSII